MKRQLILCCALPAFAVLIAGSSLQAQHGHRGGGHRGGGHGGGGHRGIGHGGGGHRGIGHGGIGHGRGGHRGIGHGGIGHGRGGHGGIGHGGIGHGGIGHGGIGHGGGHHFRVHPGSRHILHGRGNYIGTYFWRDNGYYYNPGVQNAPSQRLAYGGFSHIDELAARLETLANDYCLELHANYSRNPGFDDTYREAYQILEIAKYIHEEEHHGHRDEIAQEMNKLDSLFHHVEDVVSHWQPDRHRHHHNNIPDKDQIQQQMETIIHHLMHDVGVGANAPQGGNVRGGSAPAPNNNLQPNIGSPPSGF